MPTMYDLQKLREGTFRQSDDVKIGFSKDWCESSDLDQEDKETLIQFYEDRLAHRRPCKTAKEIQQIIGSYES